jgi:hypothetical protein
VVYVVQNKPAIPANLGYILPRVKNGRLTSDAKSILPSFFSSRNKTVYIGRASLYAAFIGVTLRRILYAYK